MSQVLGFLQKREGGDCVGVRWQREPLATGDSAFGVGHPTPKRRRAMACRRTPHIRVFVGCPRNSTGYGWMSWPIAFVFPSVGIKRDSGRREQVVQDFERVDFRCISLRMESGRTCPTAALPPWQPAMAPVVKFGA